MLRKSKDYVGRRKKYSSQHRSEKPVIPHMTQPAGSLEEKFSHDRNPIRRFFKMLGPGLIASASDVNVDACLDLRKF